MAASALVWNTKRDFQIFFFEPPTSFSRLVTGRISEQEDAKRVVKELLLLLLLLMRCMPKERERELISTGEPTDMAPGLLVGFFFLSKAPEKKEGELP
jgi:hypothetical protein